MNEAQMEFLYEQVVAGDTAAADQLIALLHADADTRDSAAWSLIELIDGKALNADKVSVIEIDAADFDAITWQWLTKAINDFEKRQPQPCPDCGRYNCRRAQRDADWFICADGDNAVDNDL